MIDQLKKLKYKVETLTHQKEYNNNELINLNTQLNEVNTETGFIIESREYYRKAVDIIYERSIVELKSILNSALSYIFYDEDYNLDIELLDKRGKSLYFRLYHNGKPANLKTGTGMGVKTVISAVLHIYYLQCKNSKVLMLDEAYAAVSEEYIDRFFNFLSEMCQKLSFKIILITHDKRLIEHGDKYYIINNGCVKESN